MRPRFLFVLDRISPPPGLTFSIIVVSEKFTATSENYGLMVSSVDVNSLRSDKIALGRLKPRGAGSFISEA